MKIRIFHTGKVCVSPFLPFGGKNPSLLKAAGITVPKKERIWLPVSVYLIEHPKGLILIDCGWHREMSPNGVFDRHAQIRSLGSRWLYRVNQGIIETGQTAVEQLAAIGIAPANLNCVLLTHLDCDHASGLRQLRGAKRILTAPEELDGARKGLISRIRFHPRWREGVCLETFCWNGTEGPAGKSFDFFGDGSLVAVNIPGHSEGLCAIKIKNATGRFVLLFSDGGYAEKSWKEMILPGICLDKQKQYRSLEWIREQSLNPNCVASLASHDPNVRPGTIEF